MVIGLEVFGACKLLDQMAEMVILGNRLMEVQLNDQQDNIIWRWTADGKYIMRSPYMVQFIWFVLHL